MKKRLQLISGLSDERGVTAIIVGLLMVVFIGIAAVVVDIGYAMATKNELQNIADGAALAATGWLGDNYSDMTTDELLNYVVDGDDEADIKGLATDVAGQNRAGGVSSISLEDVDIQIGQWDSSVEADDIDDSVRGTVNDPRFTETPDQPDAVRVITRREEGINGPISTFFARIFGIDDVGINTIATAALTGIVEVDECELYMPVGISEAWFDYWNEETGDWCDHNIKLHPTGGIEGCAGWHAFGESPVTPPKLIDILENGIQGNCNEGAETGDVFKFTGGDMAVLFDYLKALFNLMRDCQAGSPALQALLLEMQEDDPDLTEEDLLGACMTVGDEEVGPEPRDLDTDPDTWTTHVVIYGMAGCEDNPNSYYPIVGFATVEIYEVEPPPGMSIQARVKCLSYGEGIGGGGGEFGTMGTIPGLVQ